MCVAVAAACGPTVVPSRLLPRPAFDYTYTWRTAGPACPGLADADGGHGYADLQAVMRDHNAGN